MLGLGLDYFGASQDIEFGGARIAETDVRPLTLAVNFHFVRKHRFDVYVGPLVSYVSWGEIEFTPEIAAAIGQSSVSAESETAVGAQIGVDITINSRFAIVTGLRYLDVSITPEGATATGSLGVDPLIVRVGAAWRW